MESTVAKKLSDFVQTYLMEFFPDFDKLNENTQIYFRLVLGKAILGLCSKLFVDKDFK